MRYTTLFLAILLLPLVAAEDGAGIIAHSPTEGALLNPESDGFTFSVAQEFRDTPIDSCTLFLGETSKSMVLNGIFGGVSRRFTTDITDGTYLWHITCRTTDGRDITSPQRSVTIVREAASEIKVTSSGVTRGSLRHEFTLKGTPITVPKVAPGDYVKINIEIQPSKMSSDFYVKRKTAIDGQDLLILELKDEQFTLPKGENVTLPVGTKDVLAQLTLVEASRSTITFYPLGTTSVPVDETPEPGEDPVTPDESEPESEEVPQEQTPPQEPEMPDEQEPPQEQIPPPTTPPQEEPRQGFFSWILSLLARAFGT